MIHKLIDSLNIEGMTNELKNQMYFLESYCKDLNLTEEEKNEIEKNVKIFNQNMQDLKDK